MLLAFDKFKGTLSAAEACRAAEAGLRRSLPEAEFRRVPIADGGEGTLEALALAGLGEWRSMEAPNAMGSRLTRARYLMGSEDGVPTAFIELAEASGLTQLAPAERDPLRASTFGTGLVMRHALDAGAGRLVVGLGGSATNDGGMGLVRALGYRFWGAKKLELTMPSQLAELERIELPFSPLPFESIALADVSNPLLGPHGATAVFGPQKGVTKEMAEILEEGLRNLADVALRDLGRDCRDWPGAGAAGGAGFGLLTFLDATIQPGFAYLSHACGLESAVEWSDLVMTGEGKLDSQTLSGKGPLGLARLAKSLDKPAIAIAGSVEEEGRATLEKEFAQVLSLVSESTPIGLAMEQASLSLETLCATFPWKAKS